MPITPHQETGMILSDAIVQPRAFDARSRNRLHEHGRTWRVVRPTQPVIFSALPHMLLASERTGYQKWWPSDHVAQWQPTAIRNAA